MNVIGYYGPHRFRERNGLSRPENIDYEQITRINYGPFQINEHGSIWGEDVNADPQLLFGPPDWNPGPDDPMYCHQSSPDMHPQCSHHHYDEGLIGRAHSAGVEVYPVIGGPERSQKFAELASGPKARVKFAMNAVLIMSNYDFDGIDIAWQFPQSPAEMSNFGMLLSEVRLALDNAGQARDRTFGLTATLPCGHETVFIDVGLMDSILSEFNLLSFDFYGPWDDEVGINSGLYDPFGGEGRSVNSCVIKYLDGGASKSKINIGVAFFGHSYVGGKYIGDKCTANWAGVCSDTQTWQVDGGSPQYHNIYKKLPGMAQSFDLLSMTPLASNDRSVVSFDDPSSVCAKTEYAILNQLGGFMIMELTGDMLDDGSTPLLDAMNLKLLQPDINCGDRNFKEMFKWREVLPYNPYRTDGVAAESLSVEPSAESDADSKPSAENATPTYRYTCGTGEGNARLRCNSQDWDDINCDHGVCPPPMLCFVVPCTKPREPQEPEPQESHSEVSTAELNRKPRPTEEENYTSFSTEQRPAPNSVIEVLRREGMDETSARKTLPINDESYTSTSTKKQPVLNPVAEIPPQGEIEPAETSAMPANTVPSMSTSCGINHAHAKSCGKPCPNGLADCPSGQFCFWLECEESISEAPDPPVIEMQYQCGETRKEALSCSEACGFAWQCPDSKDCFNVPCTL